MLLGLIAESSHCVFTAEVPVAASAFSFAFSFSLGSFEVPAAASFFLL
jgi:hypothetical protein